MLRAVVIPSQLRQYELLQNPGERRFTESDQRLGDYESASLAIVRGEIESLKSCTGEASNHIGIVRLPMSVVSFAPNRATHRAENPGSPAARSFVVVTWILLENGRHDGAADKSSRENIGVSRSKPLCITLHSLSVVMPAICGLVNPSQHADSGEGDRIRSGFPGQFKFVFRRERGRIIAVGDIEVRNQAKDPLLLLFFDLRGRQHIRRKNSHLRNLSGNDQYDYGRDVGFPGSKRYRQLLRY